MRIYKITNSFNGKSYIGQTIQSLTRRFSAHALGKSSAISLAIAKYGKEGFSVEEITVCSSLEELNSAEKHYIEIFNTLAPNGYNLHSGGGSHKVSDETRQKQRISQLGKKQSAETVAKRANAAKGHRPYNTKPNSKSFPSKSVKCLNTGTSYPSISEAAKVLNLQTSKISNVCTGKRKSTGSLTFRFEVA